MRMARPSPLIGQTYMQCTRIVAFLHQALSQNIDGFLLVDEDNDRWIDTTFENLEQFIALVIFRAHDDDLFDALRRFAHRADVDRGWTTQIRASQSFDGRRHRGCEHHCLPILVPRSKISKHAKAMSIKSETSSTSYSRSFFNELQTAQDLTSCLRPTHCPASDSSRVGIPEYVSHPARNPYLNDGRTRAMITSKRSLTNHAIRFIHDQISTLL